MILGIGEAETRPDEVRLLSDGVGVGCEESLALPENSPDPQTAIAPAAGKVQSVGPQVGKEFCFASRGLTDASRYVRLVLFAFLGIPSVPVLLFTLVSIFVSTDRGMWTALFVIHNAFILCWAAVLGTYFNINISMNGRQSLLTRIMYRCFLPVETKSMTLASCSGMAIERDREPGVFAPVLLRLRIIDGNGRHMTVYRGKSESQLNSVKEAIAGVSDLKVVSDSKEGSEQLAESFK